MNHEISEIKCKFDEIVDFSGVEQFLDTPVKRYSSGMLVRLGFAVAAHLEPEILVVDEVLAVGDVEFLKKCLGKMDDIAKKGRTVLFVSHNMGMIRQLCEKGILLENGFLKQIGNTEDIVGSYLSNNTGVSNKLNLGKDSFNRNIFIKSAIIVNEQNEPTIFFKMGDRIKFRVSFQDTSTNLIQIFAINIKTSENQLISNIHCQDANFLFNNLAEYETIEIITDPIWYYPDKYYVSLVIKPFDGKIIKMNDCMMFEVVQNINLTERKLITAHGRYFVKSLWSYNRGTRSL